MLRLVLMTCAIFSIYLRFFREEKESKDYIKRAVLIFIKNIFSCLKKVKKR